MPTAFIFPTKNNCEILFFQSKQELQKSVAAYPEIVIPIIGNGNDTELDSLFPNVYCAMRKSVDGIGNVSDLGEMLEQAATAELVTELKTREGVETTTAEPYEDVTVIANGPAIILKVID